MNRQLRGSLLLLLAAMIWGAAFVAQSEGMNSMQPLSFNGMRQLLAGFALLIPVQLRKKKDPSRSQNVPAQRKKEWTVGFLCALFLFLSTNAQQTGLQTTAPGKAGFITALYVVLVPIANFIAFRRNPGRVVWIGVFLAVAGLYLLCCDPAEDGFAAGDLMIMACALFYTVHILIIDRFGPVVDPFRLSCMQFLISGALSVLISLPFETITLSGIRGSLIPMLYAGILSGAVGFTIQIVAQKETDPTVASLIMCLESVFAVIFGALLVGEKMSGRETLGCCLMFSAVILAQLSPWLAARAKVKKEVPAN